MAVDRRSFRCAEGEVTLVARITGAFVRMVLVMFLISLPTMMLESSADARQMAALVALFAGGLVFAEYAARHPSLIEFRDAPPFNRLKILSLFFVLLVLSVMARDQLEPTRLSILFRWAGGRIGELLNFTYSPVTLALQAVEDRLPAKHLQFLREASGVCFITLLILLMIFSTLLGGRHWPSRGRSFNVWVNLPTFDPTTGGDVVGRLERDALVNFILGSLLPFLMPLVFGAAVSSLSPSTLNDPQFLIWIMAAWFFLPASLFMRGMAMFRIAAMIREQRLLSLAQEHGRRLAPV